MLENLYGLPDGWRWATVSDVIIDAQPGFASGQKQVIDGLCHLRMNNIGPDCRLNLDSVAMVPPALAKPRHFLQPNDVLVCHTNSVKLVGKTALFHGQGDRYAFSNHLTRLRVKSSVADARWLWQVLATLWHERFFENRCKQWVNQATIERDTLLSAPVPLPPLPEQQRIVARIEALSEQSRAARAALDRAPTLVRRFRQSVLAAAFRGDLTERDPDDEPASALLERIRGVFVGAGARPAPVDPAHDGRPQGSPLPNPSGLSELPEGWVWTTIGAAFTVALGGTPARKEKTYWDGDIPWVSSGEVAFSRITTTREQITADGLAQSNAKLHPAGTVLLAMIGEGKTRGQAAILDVAATTNQNVASILCSETPVPSEWVFWWLMAHYKDTRGGGSGGAQPALNAARVREIPIPLAPLLEQRRIVARIQALFAQADAVDAAVEVARRRLAALDQAVLARAFRGEL
jgi:type I restriction enzyme, S subunit